MSQTQGGLHVIQRFMTNQTGLRRSLAAQLCLEMGPFPINLGNPGCHKPTKLGDDLWSLHIVYVTTHKVMVMTWGWWLWHWVDPTLYMILYDIYIYWFNGRLKPTQPLIHLTLHWLMILVRIPTHIIYVYIYMYNMIYIYMMLIHRLWPLQTHGGPLSRRWTSVAAAAGARFLGKPGRATGGVRMGDWDPTCGGNLKKHGEWWFFHVFSWGNDGLMRILVPVR
jgi:hypothetical protein